MKYLIFIGYSKQGEGVSKRTHWTPSGPASVRWPRVTHYEYKLFVEKHRELRTQTNSDFAPILLFLFHFGNCNPVIEIKNEKSDRKKERFWCLDISGPRFYTNLSRIQSETKKKHKGVNSKHMRFWYSSNRPATKSRTRLRSLNLARATLLTCMKHVVDY